MGATVTKYEKIPTGKYAGFYRIQECKEGDCEQSIRNNTPFFKINAAPPPGPSYHTADNSAYFTGAWSGQEGAEHDESKRAFGYATGLFNGNMGTQEVDNAIKTMQIPSNACAPMDPCPDPYCRGCGSAATQSPVLPSPNGPIGPISTSGTLGSRASTPSTASNSRLASGTVPPVLNTGTPGSYRVTTSPRASDSASMDDSGMQIFGVNIWLILLSIIVILIAARFFASRSASSPSGPPALSRPSRRFARSFDD